MRLLFDQNVPDSVATVFESRGHVVLRLRDITAPDAPDEVVATISEVEGAVLVSADRDFRTIASRIPNGQKKRFRRLSRITLSCKAPQSVTRVEVAIEMIEHEFQLAKTRKDSRMILEIGSSYLRTVR